jgi:putative transposase
LPTDRSGLLELHNSSISIREQCRLLDINRSGLYYKPVEPKQIQDSKFKLLNLVDETYTRHPFMGTRMMADYLQLKEHEGIKRHHTRWAYENLGLRACVPGPHTSRPHPENKIYPYLLRDIEIINPNQVWSTDITYIRLKHGFVYLVAIIDWYSRYVLDWELSISMEAEFCIETLDRVLANGSCDIFNTDQGAQFTSKGFTGLLKKHNIQISMDGRGRALDNIFVERLWRSVKYECVYIKEWNTVKDARSGLGEYFNFYNHERPHSSIAGNTPFSVHYN